MKIRSDTTPKPLGDELQSLLEELRSLRKFNVERYVDNKVALIDKYFESYGLKAAVIGVSGGIDSSVVLGLLSRCKNVEHIVPVLLPAYDNDGVGNQKEATASGKEVCDHFNVVPSLVNVNNVFKQAEKDVNSSLNLQLEDSGFISAADGSAWARGQLVPYLRTPLLYYHTTLLTDAGKPAVLVGTTNFSEGGYLGYIGKASDGMVDLQVIADIYKGEVYQVARYLGIPESIVDRKPTGDMFEDISDEEVFGATYDFVELFMEVKGWTDFGDKEVLDGLSEKAISEYSAYAESLEAMHNYNKHKYLGASPAVHLDVMDSRTSLDVWTRNTWRSK